MYLEFLFLIGDYFRTLKWRYVVFEWIIPLGIGCLMYCLIGYGDDINAIRAFAEFARKFSETSVTLLGIFIGFSITVITILNSSDNDNIKKIKNTATDHSIGAQKLYLFHLILINLSYAVTVEILGLVCNLCLPWILEKISLQSLKILLCFNLVLILHVILLNLRNISDFYFVLFKGAQK